MIRVLIHVNLFSRKIQQYFERNKTGKAINWGDEWWRVWYYQPKTRTPQHNVSKTSRLIPDETCMQEPNQIILRFYEGLNKKNLPFFILKRSELWLADCLIICYHRLKMIYRLRKRRGDTKRLITHHSTMFTLYFQPYHIQLTRVNVTKLKKGQVSCLYSTVKLKKEWTYITVVLSMVCRCLLVSPSIR